MRMTVQAACSRLKSHGISKQELEDFLAEYAIGGDIRIFLEVTPEWSVDYDAMRAKVKKSAKNRDQIRSSCRSQYTSR
jgi:hypothetical protein